MCIRDRSPKRCKIGPRLLWRTNRKSQIRFRLVPKSTTLDDLERRIQGLPKVLKYPLLSQEREKLRTSNFAGTFHNHRVHPNKSPLKILEKRERGRNHAGTAQCFKVPSIISGTGKATTDFKFGQYIHRDHPSKSPLKILEKRERGRTQGGTAQNF